jgi:undecaprenyl pyrophosphate phosphatase UppP
VDVEKAFKFSFLLSIPAIMGASALKASKIGTSLVGHDAAFFLAGGLTAMVVLSGTMRPSF